ncbi:peptide-N-glycosidase F-related protein [Aestuariibaculum sp. YM273]|uniref:peptide-N-glycosidase F-related protein n=1 Tax=Aestuariibaculum sp. YM273 TaxID=3070659 RepID=UPI0027DD6303|nr:peptide-N-glycosidase F-related protein [Aestuariibaculum sp. YM273]WMI65504.1 peptide-N-glycosidase F-related protein [Aestuariibaculum sp. YM273]
MKYTPLFILFLLVACGKPQIKESIHVIAHDKTTIITNPKEGVNTFTEWATFPSKAEDIRKITMYLTLAYPEHIKIAHWDYMDRVKIICKDENNNEKEFEIGRMLTPYGSSFKEGWNYTWKTDVTDFAPFLRDSVQVAYVHSGYESPETGWDLTIGFKVDFGPPVADFVSVTDMWEGNFQYGNPEDDIENYLKPITITKQNDADFGRFRIQHTGHGMDRPSGCSEFCSRWRELTFDGNTIDKRDLWKECSDNPLYPQGGTWIYDRADWCPGDLQLPDIIDTPLTKSSHVLDLNMMPFTANNIDQPKEQITSYFFQYKTPNHTNDVEIEEIIAPNSDKAFNRENPKGFHPKIKIRNLGKAPLTSVTITYNTEGFEEKSFEWVGNLPFYESTVITIPDNIEYNSGVNHFTVTLTHPNSKKDEWIGDNTLTSEFDDIPTLPTNLVVDFLTNNNPGENHLTIVDSNNKIVFEKTPNHLETATQYFDTLNLAEGKYSLKLTDTAGDGLEFWYNRKAGFGRLQLKDINHNIVHAFENDFGNELNYTFRTSKSVKTDLSTPKYSVTIYPRMTRDSLSLYTTANKTFKLKVRLTKDGVFIEEHTFENVKDSKTPLDVSHLEEGRYVMEIHMDSKHIMNRRFNKI